MRSANKNFFARMTSPKNDAIYSRCTAIDLRMVKADAQPSTLEEQTVITSCQITWISPTEGMPRRHGEHQHENDPPQRFRLRRLRPCPSLAVCSGHVFLTDQPSVEL